MKTPVTGVWFDQCAASLTGSSESNPPPRSDTESVAAAAGSSRPPRSRETHTMMIIFFLVNPHLNNRVRVKLKYFKSNNKYVGVST